MSRSLIEESPSQRELARVLSEDKDAAKRLRETALPDGDKPIHRTKLWVYATGRGKPNVETAAFLERLVPTVTANGWETDVRRSDGEGSATGTDGGE